MNLPKFKKGTINVRFEPNVVFPVDGFILLHRKTGEESKIGVHHSVLKTIEGNHFIRRTWTVTEMNTGLSFIGGSFRRRIDAIMAATILSDCIAGICKKFKVARES